MALLEPFNLIYVPSDIDRPVHYASVRDGSELHLRWQPGISARLNGRLEIVGPDGAVIAAEGAPSKPMAGGNLGNGDVFTVCLGEYNPTHVGV